MSGVRERVLGETGEPVASAHDESGRAGVSAPSGDLQSLRPDLESLRRAAGAGTPAAGEREAPGEGNRAGHRGQLLEGEPLRRGAIRGHPLGDGDLADRPATGARDLRYSRRGSSTRPVDRRPLGAGETGRPRGGGEPGLSVRRPETGGRPLAAEQPARGLGMSEWSQVLPKNSRPIPASTTAGWITRAPRPKPMPRPSSSAVNDIWSTAWTRPSRTTG